MKQSSKRLFSMVLSLVFFVVALLIFFDLIQPTYGDLQQKKGTEIGLNDYLTQEQHTVDQAKKLIAQYQSETAAQQNLALAMPSGPNVASALAQIYGIATNNNVAVQGINVSPPVVQLQQQAQAISTDGGPLSPAQVIKPSGNISFQLSATGSYESLKAFISQLETNLRIFDLSALSIQPSTGVLIQTTKGAVAPTADFFTYSITVETYYQVP